MKSISFVLALLFTSALFSQSFIDKNYSNFTERDDVTRVQVSSKMFNFASIFVNEIDDVKDEKIADFVNGIKSFDLLMVPSLTNPFAEYKKGIAQLGQGQDELIRVKDKTTHFALLVKENNGIVTQLTGIGAIDSSFLIFSLEGSFDINELSKIADQIQEEGFKHLNKSNTRSLDHVKVYPNPVGIGSELNLDIPQNLDGGTMKIFDNSGKLISESTVISGANTKLIDQYNPGEYVVEISKESTSVRKKFIVIK